ncbi:hypothetical protein EXS74_03140 [Candidatus Woesearchaeota archaeon]|nr:hypothetical protein [Candidatus Woesearchaeota archaeon]
MAYEVYHSETFDKQLKKFPKEFHIWLEKIEDQLLENPYVGDPLRVPWFREKKHDKFRVYYLIYDSLQVVFLVAISEKKDQKRTINTVFLLLDIFEREIKELIK